MGNARLGTALRTLRERKRVSLRALETAMGMSFTTIADRERGLGRDLDDDEIDAYLKAVGATREDLQSVVATVRVPSRPTDTIPLLPSIASAGRAWLDRGDAQDFPGDTRPIPRGPFTTHPAAFAITVEGTSMEPYFKSGEVIVCEPIEDENDVARLQNDRTVVAWISPAVKQSSLGKPPQGAEMATPAGCIGSWEWLPDHSGLLRKKNTTHKPVWIPAKHDGRVFLAVVVAATRPVY
jgi:transcriptional regulator with XRE-family HTH domain